jgi:outer membrane immunogenic protein
MKRVVLAALCSTALVSAAQAADAKLRYTKAPAPAAQAFTWTGVYAGGNIGYGWGTTSFDGSNTSLSPSGVNGGAQVGYNYQIDRFVLGVEADFQGADHHDGVSAGALGVNASLDVRSDWYATIRGRVGYAFGQFLPYVTGGIAFADSKADVNVAGAGGNVAGSASDTLTGYAVGGGLEYAITNNWTIRGEYLYLGFDDHAYNVLVTAPGVSVTLPAALSAKTDLNIARLAVNYKF